MYLDTHAHLQVPRFATDLQAVLERAHAAGVTGIINVGYDLASSQAALEMARGDASQWAVVGIHPHSARLADEAAISAIAEMASDPRVVGIGETGLDFFRDLSPRPLQRALMRRLAALAWELGKALVIHSRDAYDEVLEILAAGGSQAGASGGPATIMHCFAGSSEVARECLGRGYLLGIGGPVTYPRSEELREIVARAPLGQLLLETDCPYLPPQPFRGKRNEPAYLPLVAQEVAGVRGTEVGEVARACGENARRAFGLGAE